MWWAKSVVVFFFVFPSYSDSYSFDTTTRHDTTRYGYTKADQSM